jgi:predicted transcriptional regulator
MPTLSELQDVLDWQAVAVMQGIDDREGATLEEAVAETNFEWDRTEHCIEQLVAIGLVKETEVDEETVYELTGSGHGAAGAGLYDEYDLDRDDVDDLAESFADLLDRRDDLRDAVEDLRTDAERLQADAQREFGDREDVSEEVDSLLADIERLSEALEADE